MKKIFELFGEIVIRNEEANAAIDETVEKAEKSKSRLNTSLARIGAVSKKAAGVFATAAVAVGGAMFSLAENTRQYRTEMGKLDTAFVTNGHSSSAALETYKSLQSILGETDQAVEAANHLAKLTDNEKDLQTWTNICTGVFATFGASLPIEGLTEAANETAKVGQVTGPLADALNWAGIREDEFNKKLAACSTEQERQTLIMETLNSTYSAAAEQYKKTNEKVIESNAAHDNLNAAMAKLGDAAEPAITLVINAVAKLAESATPIVEGITNAVLWLGDAWQTLKAKIQDITATAEIAVKYNLPETTVQSAIETQNTTKKSVWDMVKGIKWNAEGAIFNKPVIFNTRMGLQGVGEAGAEAVAPIDKLQQYVSDAVKNTVGGMQFNVVLDTGVLVGQLAPRMDMQLGTLANRRGRG